MPRQLSDFEKGQIIAYSDCDKSNYWIAKKFKRSENTIKNLLKKWNTTGSVERKKGTGRKRSLSTKQEKTLVREAKRNRKMTRKQLKLECGLNVCDSTITNYLHANGYYCRRTIAKPFVSDQNQIKRLKFAQDHIQWRYNEWSKVMWSDESRFTLYSNHQNYVWRKSDEKHNPECMKGTIGQQKSVMVWGCFGGKKLGKFHRIEGTLNYEKYYGILRYQMRDNGRKIFNGSKWLFQHDNAPPHKKANREAILLKSDLFDLMEWPAQSPDINPIENLWGIIETKTKDRKCKNEDELFELLQQAWNEIQEETLEKLIQSMHKRCEQLIASNGFPIKY